MRPARFRALLLAALATFIACDGSRTGDQAGDRAEDGARAAYSREMIFIAADATGAALLDFTATDAGSVVRRTARGWAEAGSGWTPLYDLSWEGTAVRRPWRLVPNGPIRLRVGLNDEIEAISVRDQDTDLAVLETGDFIAGWEPFHTTQLVLREATLALGGEPMRGWLVDARFGVTQQAAEDTTGGFAPVPDQPREVAPAAEMPQDDSAGAAPTPANPDSVMNAVITQFQAGSTPSALPVRSLRGVLVADGGETLVIAETDTGLGAWLWTDDGETTMPIVTLTRVEGERETWTIEAGGATTLAGTLTVMDEEPLPVSPRIVRGTIDVGDDSLEMHGVLRAADISD
jgi:hypothetical protein